MDFFLVNKESEAANSLMLKLAGEKKKGELIPCTKDEMNALNKGDIVHVHSSENNSEAISMIEVDPSKAYVVVVNERYTNIDDVLATGRMLPEISIIRICKDT